MLSEAVHWLSACRRSSLEAQAELSAPIHTAAQQESLPQECLPFTGVKVLTGPLQVPGKMYLWTRSIPLEGPEGLLGHFEVILKSCLILGPG